MNSSYLPVNKGKTMNSPSHKLPDQNQEAKGSFSSAPTCKWVHWPNNTMVAVIHYLLEMSLSKLFSARWI